MLTDQSLAKKLRNSYADIVKITDRLYTIYHRIPAHHQLNIKPVVELAMQLERELLNARKKIMNEEQQL